MRIYSLRIALLGPVMPVGLAMSTSDAAFGSWRRVAFDFVPTTILTANTDDITTAATVAAGAPDLVTGCSRTPQ